MSSRRNEGAGLREFICRDRQGSEWKIGIAYQTDDGRWHCRAHLERRTEGSDEPAAEGLRLFHADTPAALAAQIEAAFPGAGRQVTFSKAKPAT